MAVSKPGFFWKIYFFIYSLYTLSLVIQLMWSDSFPYLYYHTLLAFDKGYLAFYIPVLGMVVVNVISLIPLFLYVFEIPFLKPEIWQILLALRIIFDVTGHTLELKFFEAIISNADLRTILSMITLVGCLIGPSYMACFQYAFGWEKIFQKKT